MASIRTRFYPLVDHSEHDVINYYSTLQTGLAGTLVKIVTGAANPQVPDGWAVGSSVGAAVALAQAISMRYETKMKVTPTVSGDSKYNALGLTFWSTLEYDENGIPLRYNDQRAREIGAVRSGEAVPILTKAGIVGIWGQYIDQAAGAVQPGNLAVVSNSGNGLLASVVPGSTNFGNYGTTGGSVQNYYTANQVVGKWLTSLPTAPNTGVQNEFAGPAGSITQQGGYALLSFNCYV